MEWQFVVALLASFVVFGLLLFLIVRDNNGVIKAAIGTITKSPEIRGFAEGVVENVVSDPVQALARRLKNERIAAHIGELIDIADPNVAKEAKDLSGDALTWLLEVLDGREEPENGSQEKS